MEKISSIALGVSLDTLKAGFERGRVPDVLTDSFQVLLPRLTKVATNAPTSVYLFSSDEYAATRNFFGYALTKALQRQIPSALLVDCGFMDLGMNGVIPQQDALGFLDLLLYGSSLGVITQETVGGVHVVGAGSFPVTKKMPFVLNAFNEASRRLIGHTRCAIFCGPLYDDEGDLHPLIGAVDIPMLVRGAGAMGTVDPIEEQIASNFETELISVRISPEEAVAEQPEPAPDGLEPLEPPTPPVSVPIDPAMEELPEGTPQFEELVPSSSTTSKGPAETPAEPVLPPQPPASSTTPPSSTSSAPPDREQIPRDIPVTPPVQTTSTIETKEKHPRHGEKRYSSLLPKVATAVIALLVIVFIVWWMNEERGGPADPVQQPPADVAQTLPSTATTDDSSGEPETSGESIDLAGAGQEPATSPPPGETESGTATEPAPAQTVAESPGTGETGAVSGARIDSRDIIVMDDLLGDYPGSYLIHISSFRESAKARDEISYLEGRGFHVFIVFLDLGTKGTWYRVYAGPLDTRDDARNLKKLLDGTPRVRFTRITRVSGSS